MGKRTSDFVALAAIVGGGGLGFGLTSLFAGAAPEVQVHDTSVEIRVVPGRVLMGPSSTIYLGRPGAYASSKGFRVTMDRRRAEMRFDREDVERLTAQAEKLLREALEEGDFSAVVMSEALERLDAIEIIGDLDIRVDGTTIDILRGNVPWRVEVRAGTDEDEDDDRRRRRRGRRPREEAEVRASGASGNR